MPGTLSGATGTLDAERPRDANAEHELSSGRLAAVPVSWYWVDALTVSGAHDVMFRAQCSEQDVVSGRCDTGMLVHFGAHTLYNNDDPAASVHGGGSTRGSFIDPAAQASGQTYTVRVFSQQRATSRTSVAFSLDGGVTWTGMRGGQSPEVGGAVVRVGALLPGDFLEVQTRTDGFGVRDTTALLFSMEDDLSRPAVLSDDQSGSDRDPRIDVTSQAWQTPRNYLLLGKLDRDGATNEAIETHVDLVHGPLARVGTASRTGCAGVCSTQLAPGSYLVSVSAKIQVPVGSTAFGALLHLSGNMPVLGADGCPNDARDGYGDAQWYRGQPNDIAFDLVIEQRSEAGGFVSVASRSVPRGALGSEWRADPGLGWNRIALPLEVAAPGEYRVQLVPRVSGLLFEEAWRWERNPDASELKVVTYNTLFVASPWAPNKYLNAADLLGTRGSIERRELRVEERPDQAPFQWDADIIGMQEVLKEGAFNAPGYQYTDLVREELLRRTSYGWAATHARGETWPTGLGDGPGMNPVFVRESLLRDLTPQNAYFSAAAKAYAECHDEGRVDYAECHLSARNMGDDDVTNYTAAARAVAWRNQDRDRPIAVFNVHMEASDGPRDFAPRVGEVDSLMEKIDRLLWAQPEAFNSAPDSDGSRRGPLHPQNRAIIVGDWNIRAHECGEHYWLLRRLRAHYGYAVDVSMARTDALGSLLQSMHVSEQGYGSDEVPVFYQHMFSDDPRPQHSWQAWKTNAYRTLHSRFPWWATDWRGRTAGGDGAGERLSMIVLVGQGWADDDPVLSYSVMSDSNHVSPMNERGMGVEMWQAHDLVYENNAYKQVADCAHRGLVADDERGYAPNYPLGCGETGRGAPALHSDHKPMGARLRVWSR